MKTTLEERERHALVLTPNEDLPCSTPGQILAERTEALAARLSQLEGSTRAALAKIEKALARHDGDLAELHGRATAIATGADDAIHAIHAKLAPLVASHVGMGEIVGPTERAIDDLAVVMEERDTARAERSVALVERDQARAALAEALVQRDGAMSDRSAFLHAGEQRALQLVEARAAIADLEARLAAMSRARDVCAVQRDALVNERDVLALQLDDMTRSRDIVAAQRDAIGNIVDGLAIELKRDAGDRVETGEIVERMRRMKRDRTTLVDERNAATRALNEIRDALARHER